MSGALWAAFRPVLQLILEALIPFLWEKAQKTAEDSQSDQALSDRLHTRINATR
jgi:hypothetical protein